MYYCVNSCNQLHQAMRATVEDHGIDASLAGVPLGTHVFVLSVPNLLLNNPF